MKSKFLLAVAIFITCSSILKAQVITTFKPRYQVTQKGGIVFLSNVATTCFVADTNALPPNTGATNNSLPSLYVDRDNDASTFSSTSDSLNLATCSEISFVGLYWGGNATSATGGWATKDQIKIKANNGSYIDVTADSLITNTIGFTTYHCFKDVTDIVKTAGLNARWTVANVIGQTSANNKFAGWNMIVVYKNDLQNMRQLTVFNGLAVVNTATVDIPVTGFLTPPTGPVTFEMGLYCYDGDRSTTGDALSFSGTGPFVAVSDAINGANNAFNSTIGRNGVLTPFRKPNYNNNYSVDADIFIPDNSAKNYIGNGATSCTLRQTTSGDVYLTQAVTFAIDVYSPDVRTAVSVQDINGGTVQPGDTLEYTVTGKNIGSDPSINTFITDSIEANADYIPGTITITAGPNLGLKTDGTGDDQAEYLSATKTVKVRIGTGANGTIGGQVNDSPFGIDSTTFTFLVRVSSDCYKIACDNIINNSALITGTGITSGISYTNASNPGIFDAFGCPIPGATTTPINSSSCVAPPDTSIEVCNIPSAPTFASIYTRPGYVFYNSGGTIVASPSAAGSYYAVYTAYSGCTDTVNITITFKCNIPPVLDNETNFINEDTQATGDLTDAGDIDPDGTALTVNVTPLSGPSNGVVLINPDGTYTYTPNANFNGTDIIVVQICDNGTPLPIACVNDTIFVTITPVNDPPVADNETHTIAEDGSANGDLTNAGDADPDGTALTATTTPVVPPANGSIVINSDGTYTYTPNSNFNGTDLVVVEICDAGIPLPAACVNDTIFITVTPLNDPPVVDNETHTIAEDGSAIGDLTNTGDTDPDGTALTTTSTPVVAPSNGSIIINADGTYTYTPNSNFNGTDLVVVEICDAGIPLPAVCVNDTIFITVTPVNDPPVVDNESHTIAEDGNATGDLTNAGDSDPDATALTATTTPVVAPLNGSIVINADGTYTYTPNPNFNGTDLVVVEICDAGIPLPAACVNDTIFITVTPLNDPPVANDDNGGTLTEDGANATINIITNDTDPEGNPTAPTNGVGQFTIDLDPGTAGIQTTFTDAQGVWTYNSATGEVTFDPADNYNGTAVIPYTLCDPSGACDNADITFVVNPVNDPPVVDNEFHTIPQDAIATGDLTDAGDSDPDGTLLTATTTPVLAPLHGTIIINADGTYTYDADLGYVGTDMVVVEICDAGIPAPPACVLDTIFITTTSTNAPPVANDNNYSTSEDVTLNGATVLANDTDPDNNINTNSVTLVSGTTNGSLTLNADGTFSYIPDSNYNGTDQFTYSMCDLGAPVYCDTAVVTITVNGVNDPPLIDNETHTIPEDGSTSGDLTDGGDSDPDGTALTANTTSVVAPSNGSIVINTDGTYTYTPDPGYNGTDLVVVEICDAGIPGVECVNDSIFITVTPVNDPPVVDNETHVIDEDTQASGDLTDGGDSDPDGTTLTANTTPVVAPSNGSIVINTDGTYTYTPNPHYNGTDLVVVEICDAGIPGVECVNDTIFITVSPVNDAPVADDDNGTTDEDTPTTIAVLTNDSDVDNPLQPPVVVSNPANGTVTVNADSTITYTPNLNFNGNDTFTYTICDGGTPDLCDTATVIISVTPINDAPVATDNTNTTDEETAVNGDVYTDGNDDSDVDGPAINVTTVSGPGNGTITLNLDGTYTYTPDAGFNGNDTVTYSYCDGGTPDLCDTAILVITVSPVNDAPVADDDNGTTDEDTPTTIAVLTNDSDADNPLQPPVVVSNPANGTVTVNADSTITYTPNVNFNGNDTFTYVICDGGTPNLCDTATVIITVTPINDAPVATDNTNTTDEETAVSGNVYSDQTSDSDVDGPGINITPVSGPNNGIITLNTDGSYTYTPGTGFNGNDTVTYSYCDGGTPDLCDTALLVITVNAINDAPVANDDAATTDEDTPTTIAVLTNDSDVDNPLQPPVVVSNPANGTVTVNADSTITYTPNVNFNGTDTFTYTICDGGTPDLCDTAMVIITVNAVNDAPIANDDTNTTDEDTPVNGTVSTNDTDVDGPSINITEVIPPANGTVTLNGNGTYTYTPNTDFNGSDTVTYSYCDGGTPDLCDTAILVITIYAVNDTPAIGQPPLVLPEDSAITFCPVISDPDAGDMLTISFCGGPYGGTASLTGNCINYSPNANFNGVDSICLVVCDDGNPVLCDTIVVSITVTAANDAPVAVDDANSTEEETPVSGTVVTNDSDVDGPGVNDTPVSGPSNGAITLNVDGSYIYTPNTGFNGNDTIVYSYCDGGTPDLCDTALLIITVAAVNDTPVIGQSPLVLPEDSTIIFCPVLSDPDAGDVLTVNICGGPFNGLATANANCITYTPGTNYNGEDSICLIVCDNGTPVLCDTVIVPITVTPVNDKPIANDDVIITLEETPVVITVLANDSDVEGALNNPTVIDQPSNGTVVVNVDGTITYTPNNGFNGVDTFVYVVCDTGQPALCDTAVVIVTVNAQNDPPVAIDDNITTTEDTPITINVLSNDSDPEGNIDPAPAVIDNPENGTVTVNTDGTITYTPNPDYNGADSFTYVICDSAGLCDTAMVYVTVAPAPDAPVVIPVPLVTDEDVPGIQCFSYTTDDNLDSVSISVNCPASNGTVDSVYLSDGQICIAYTPYQNYNGLDSTCIQLCDLSNGLCVTVTVPVTVNPKEDLCYWLKGISPNGDNQNDNFWVNCNDEFPDATLRVFNRWGDEVWRSDGHYMNDWFGRNMRDQSLPDGTYYYMYEYNRDGRKAHAGFVTINR